MRYRRRLRSRIILSFLLLGLFLTAAFAASVWYMRQRLETQLIDEWLQREAVNFVEFKRENPEPSARYELAGQQINLLIARPDSPSIPMEWRSLGTGVYALRDPGIPGRDANYKLAVERQDDMVAFIRYGYGRQVLDQQQLIITLSASVVLFTLLAGLVGLSSSRRVMRPVSDLARRVRDYRGSDEPAKLAPQFADDEVGELANALDDYAQRLTERVVRDREFNADVSHELRTPLAVIRGATELMLGAADLTEKSRQRLLRIERAVQQCTDLTTALLMLSRNERGTGHTDLRKLAEQLVDMSRTQLGGKPVEVRVAGEDEAFVEVPEAVLSVALGNLIGNAVKYTAEGEIVVRIGLREVWVEDTGPGITAEDAEKLFERGYRGTGAMGTKGAGIGLSIVSRLCELYDWHVKLAPRGERGAIATLTFGRPLR
jgi:signal transduction histidine kinase